MKTVMKRSVKTLGAMVLGCGLTISQAFAEVKGWVSFEDLAENYGEPKVEINLGAAMMGFVGQMAKNEDPDTAEMLSKLEQVRVLVYNTKGDAKEALSAVDKVTKKIRKDNWQPIVSVNEDHEKIRVFAKYTDKTMDGLVVMVVDGGLSDGDSHGEVIFINIVGEIDPQNVSKVTKSFNVDVEMD